MFDTEWVIIDIDLQNFKIQTWHLIYENVSNPQWCGGNTNNKKYSKVRLTRFFSVKWYKNQGQPDDFFSWTPDPFKLVCLIRISLTAASRHWKPNWSSHIIFSRLYWRMVRPIRGFVSVWLYVFTQKEILIVFFLFVNF